MEWMLLPIKRYAEFSGRSRRKEYWMFVLLHLVVMLSLIALMIVSMVGLEQGERPGVAFWVAVALYAIVTLALLVPSIAVQVRRFHDLGYSGWFWLLNLVPYIGPLIVLVFMCMEGTAGPNSYGNDPKRVA